MSKPRLVIVTGLSGAGNSTALNALADGGFNCIDNLPIKLLEPTIQAIESGDMRSDHGVAIGMDARSELFAEEFPRLKKLMAGRVALDVVFLTADSAVIGTRYSATRRRHPLLTDGETLVEAIQNERELLAPVEEAADGVIDTTSWSPHMLARAIEKRYAKEIPPRTLHLTISSFGFKYGQARAVDSMFDVRHLLNPFFEAELKNLSGLDSPVRDFVLGQERAKVLVDKIEDLNRFLLPQYYAEGKHYFRIGVGCSGGRHRSVAIAEELGARLAASPLANVITTVIHRDLDRYSET